jgi:hypothetical protein
VPDVEGHREEKLNKEVPRGERYYDSEEAGLRTVVTWFIKTIRANHKLSKMGIKG